MDSSLQEVRRNKTRHEVSDSHPYRFRTNRQHQKDLIAAQLCRAAVLAALCLVPALLAAPQQKQAKLELSRPVRSFEFVCAVGQKSAVFGNESGTVEAWVYPLKLFRDFSLIFHLDDHDIPAAALARTVLVRPEST